MSVVELQKTIARLPPGQRRVVAKFVARIKRQGAATRQTNAGAMRSVLGCARKVQPARSSHEILADMRGYERGEL